LHIFFYKPMAAMNINNSNCSSFAADLLKNLSHLLLLPPPPPLQACKTTPYVLLCHWKASPSPSPAMILDHRTRLFPAAAAAASQVGP
jgi:hypothetical protein